MAHRYNSQMGRKTPKPSATERTWSRWRGRNNLETKQDEQRISRIAKVKEKALERLAWIKNMRLLKK